MSTDVLSPTISADPIGEINKYDFHTESKPVFRARNTAVIVDMKTFKSTSIPAWLRARFEAAM